MELDWLRRPIPPIKTVKAFTLASIRVDLTHNEKIIVICGAQFHVQGTTH